jgi:branched-chain amino acid transport system permease protein
VTDARRVPDELTHLAEVRWGRRVGVAMAIVVAIVLPVFLSASRQNLLSALAIFALIGVSLLVLTGWAGQISLGQMALVGIGAAVAGSLSADRGLDFVLTLVAAGGVGTLVAIVLGLPALRIRGLFLAVTTLAFAVVTSNFLLRQGWLVPGGAVARPVLFGRLDLEADLTYYYVCLTLLVFTIVAVRNLRASRIGRAIVGIRDNERAAQAFGVNAIAAKLAAFAVSGGIAGIAGGLLVYQQHGLPATQYAPQQSLAVFLIAMIGGLGSLPGAILGALYIKGSQYLLQGTWAFLASGVGVLVLLLILPSGLGSLVFRMRDALLRVIAKRHRIEVPSLVADRRIETEDDSDPELRRQPLGMSAHT